MNVYFEVIMSNKWKNLNIKPNQQEMYNIAMRARYNIWSRTKSGRDYLGYPFAPYSEKYRLIREKLHKTTETVNLEFTNRMLSSIQIASRPTESYIYFADANRRKIAYYHNIGEGRLPRREFFALSSQDNEELAKFLFNQIEKRIMK